MRIASGTTDQYVYFVAVDATDLKSRETGLTGFSVYRSRNGAAAAAMTTPTVNETDSTNMPGVYELLLDEDTTIAAGNSTEELALHITATGMAPVTRTIELYRPTVTEGETITASSGAVAVVGTVIALGANAINAAAIAASALNGKGDWNIGKTGYSITGTKTTLDALNDVAATDIVSAGAITTLSGAVVNVDTVDAVTTLTGHTPQTGDSFARIGAAGAGLTNINLPNQTMDITGNLSGSVGSVTGAVGSVTGNVGGIAGTITTLDALDTAQDTQHGTTQTDISNLNNLSAAQVNAEVVDVLDVDLTTLPGQEAPPASPTLRGAIAYLYKFLRNRVVSSATGVEVYNDAGTTVDHKASHSDDTTDFDRSKYVSGP